VIWRSRPTSARQSPPMASEIARSQTILPGSWLASRLRHGANADDSAAIRPVAWAVRANATAPACDTTPDPVASTPNSGYDDVDFLTRLVLRFLRIFRLQQSELSQFRAPFSVNGGTAQRTPPETDYHESPRLVPLACSRVRQRDLQPMPPCMAGKRGLIPSRAPAAGRPSRSISAR
jgi:hypothetical protein